jgi:predicted dehydrogenase
MKKIRMGWIGCGGISKVHAQNIQSLSDRMEVTCLVDIVPERAQAVVDLVGSGQVETDYRKVYDKVDAVLLSLPHDLHCQATLDFLAAGKHVLVEKPMANSEEECRQMIAAARKANRKLMVAYCMRYHPLVMKMKELIDSQEYGEVFQVSIWTEQHTEYPQGHWGLSAKRLGGGQFFSHGCHYVDLLLLFLGRPVQGFHMGTRRGTPWMEKEGTSNAVIEFEDGKMGYHFGTWGARGTKLGYSFHAHCTKGMLEFNLNKGTLSVHVNGQETVLMESGEVKPMIRQMSHFLDCIEDDTQPLTDPVSSLEGLRVIWKLYEAEEKGTLADLRNEGFGSLAKEWKPMGPVTLKRFEEISSPQSRESLLNG